MKTEKSGGRPKKETIGFDNKKTIGFQKGETKPKPNVNANVNVNDNVNANVNVNDKVSDSCVDGLQEVIDFYENNVGLMSPYVLEVLSDYKCEMTTELIIYALKKSVEADKRTIQYIKGILNNWSKKGIKTLIDAKREDEEFKSKRASNMQEESEEQKNARRVKELEEALKNDKW